jgi:hypothetical protein
MNDIGLNYMSEQNITFISYSTRDKSSAEIICNWLEKNNIRCWMAPRDISPGLDYGEAIIDAIHISKIAIVVFSSDANESKFVKKEVERAVSKGATIIVIRLHNVVPTKAMEFFLSSGHWLDAIAPPFEEHLKKLVITINQLSAGSVDAAVSPLINKSAKDHEDIRMLNEIAPDDWYVSPKGGFSKWMKNIFTDKT